jgi:hypothetical protein
MYAYCSGTLSTGSNGEPLCSVSWTAIPQDAVLSAYQASNTLTASDFGTLWSAALYMLVLAFGLRLVRRVFA